MPVRERQRVCVGTNVCVTQSAREEVVCATRSVCVTLCREAACPCDSACVRVHAWARAAERRGGWARRGAEDAGRNSAPLPCRLSTRAAPRSAHGGHPHRQPRPFAGRSPRAHLPPHTAARPAPAVGGSSRGKSRGWAGSGPRRRGPTPLPSRAAPRAALPVPTLFTCGRNWDFPSACSAGRDLHAGLIVSCRPERV